MNVDSKKAVPQDTAIAELQGAINELSNVVDALVGNLQPEPTADDALDKPGIAGHLFGSLAVVQRESVTIRALASRLRDGFEAFGA